MQQFIHVLCVLFIIAGGAGRVRAQALKVVEKLAEQLVRREGPHAAREILQQGALKLERSVAFHESEEAVKILSRRMAFVPEEKLFARFNRIQGVDGSLRAEFRALSLADRRLVVELGEGVQQVLRRYPTDGLDLLRHLDVGGLAQARTYGDFVFEGVQWVHTDEVLKTLQASKLHPEEASAVSRALGLKTVLETLEPKHLAPLWKSLIRKTGDGAGSFWRNYIKPHKGKWLAGGLLVTYLAMPEKFHYAAGNLTEYGVRRLTEFGISVGASAGQGAVNGPVAMFKKRYADHPIGTILGLVLIGGFILLAVPPVRGIIFNQLLLRLWKSTQTRKKTTPGFSYRQPLRE